MAGPLVGLVVADFSRILAGPYATMLLADMGADVVKVEGPAGDDTRTWTPPVREIDGKEVSTYYLGVNRNKRSIALDFTDDADLAVARRLAARADIVIENFRPGGLTRFGLDYDTVAAGNPAVVYASISGFGSTPEGAKLPGYDLIVQAISGLMSLTGDPDGPPYRAGISVFDVMAGLHATIGILAALRTRAESGRGQHVEVSLLSSALSGLVNQSSAYAAGGTIPFRMGNSHPSLFPYEPFPCSDRDLIVTAGNNQQFRKLVEVLGATRARRRPALRPQRGPHRQPRRAPAAAGRPAQGAHRDGVVRGDHRRGRAVRADQHHRRWLRVRREHRSRPGRDRRRGGCGGAVGPAPDRFLRDAGGLPPAAAGARRARRRDPRVARGGPMTPEFPTSLGTSTADEIRLLGQDLAADLMGQVGFGELAFWLVALRRPTPQETRVFEAVLVALADHGFTPTAIAARLTYLSAPDSLQGALAAGLLGGGSRFLGVTEDCGTYLHEVIESLDALPTDDAGWDAVALDAVRRTRAEGRYVPGLGHPVHKVEDPRTPVLVRIADEEGLRGPHLRLFEAIGRTHEEVLGRRLPLNGAGVCGAALADLGLPVEMLRGFALLARAAGLLGQIAEERRRPIGMEAYLTIDRNAVYVDPES